VIKEWGRDTLGTGAEASSDRVVIRFGDGTELDLPTTCEHVAEFASLLWPGEADEPVVTDAR